MSTRRRLLSSVLGALCLAAASAPAPTKADDLPTIDRWHFRQPVETLHVKDAEELQRLFAASDFWLAEVRRTAVVPRTYLHRLVDDLHTVAPVPAREALFIRIVLPLIIRANADILAQRAHLKRIVGDHARKHGLSAERRRWLHALARRYGGRPTDLSDLLTRVDAIPPSLAIAQAIDESGWGTAPLARQSNGLFGEHAPPGAGRGRLQVPGTDVDVASFPSLLDGVLAYVTNLNRHAAYATLRAVRARLRKSGGTLSGHALAEGLADYSVRGMAYVNTLRSLIATHRLEMFDRAKLAADGRTVLIKTGR
jgi:Bax protein